MAEQLELGDVLKDQEEFFSKNKFVPESIIRRIKKVSSSMRVPRDGVESAQFDHNSLVVEISWLASFCSAMVQDANQKLAARRGAVVEAQRSLAKVTGAGGKLTDYALKAVVEADANYQEINNDVIRKTQLYSFLDSLKWSMKNRAEIINSLARNNE
jgi:hypothetical protein